MKKNFLRIAFAAALFVLSATSVSNAKPLRDGTMPAPNCPWAGCFDQVNSR